jgi:hypothetical protein
MLPVQSVPPWSAEFKHWNISANAVNAGCIWWYICSLGVPLFSGLFFYKPVYLKKGPGGLKICYLWIWFSLFYLYLVSWLIWCIIMFYSSYSFLFSCIICPFRSPQIPHMKPSKKSSACTAIYWLILAPTWHSKHKCWICYSSTQICLRNKQQNWG